MSDSLRPHGLQHARLPCPSLSPRVCSHSCPLRLDRAFFPLTLWKIDISMSTYHHLSFYCLLIYHLSSVNHAFIIYPSFTIIYLATIYLSNSTISVWPSVVARGEALPAMQRTWVPSVGQEDPLEEAIATLFNILPGESHGQRSLVGYSPWSKRVRHDSVTKQQKQQSFIYIYI